MIGEHGAPEPPQNLEPVVRHIAGLLRYGGGVLSVGDVASLRRMEPTRPVAAFFKLAGLALDEELSRGLTREELETRWASIVIGLAHLGELHRPGARLGRALAEAEFSELRFARLLRADAPRLIDELPALARFLTSKGVRVDWTGAAWLMLSGGRSDEESVRRRLARDYFRALAGTVTT